jgi:hypothetical protein
MSKLISNWTGWVVIWKVAVVCPAGTSTLAGTEASVLLLPRVTVVPPAGAGDSRVTSPVELLPPVTVDGLRMSATGSGVTVNTADTDDLPSAAVTVTDVTVLTAPVVKVNTLLELPAGIVTDAGTASALLSELVKVTVEPPLGAARLSWTSMIPVLLAAGF